MPRLTPGPKIRRRLRVLRDWRLRLVLVLAAGLIVSGIVIPIVSPYLAEHSYKMGNAEAVLPEKDQLLAGKLEHDYKKQVFKFNEGYFPGSDTAKGGGPKISAVSYEDPKKGLSVSDPYSNIDFTIVPKFKLLAGKKDGNRVIYPLLDGTGWLVYTMLAGSVKEDVVLRHANGNRMMLEYELKLGDDLAARLMDDGAVGVYGSGLPIGGNVSTGTDKDAELLKKARLKAPKNKLLFSLPAPVAYEADQAESPVKVHYELDGKILKTVASGLKKGRYPLTIDPTVTVTSATDLFRDTNPESNVDFDATTGNISRGAITGGVIPAWSTNSNNLAANRFLHSSVIYDDYAYVAGGATTNTQATLSTVEYARLNSANATIGTWSSTTSLPAATSRFQLLAYNGYLYAVGGATTSTSCATVTTAIYYNRIQANGQLSGTWTSGVGLPSAVCGLGAAVYDGKMYIIGGRTGSAVSNGTTTVAYATIRPNGSLSSWTTDNSPLPEARYDHDVRIYNGYIYVVGGNTGGTGALTNTVLYAPLGSDGSIYGTGSASWKSASSFGTARSNLGSSFSSAYDGYMYVHGGCSTLNVSQTCTAVRNETQIAQINADGSLGPWSDVAVTVSSLSRVGNAISIWRGTVYSFAGCSSMSTSVIACLTGYNTQSYSTISTPGQVGPVNATTVLPTGLFAHGSAVLNGYIYVIGGCITNSCQTGTSDTTGAVRYALLNADGTIGSWNLDANSLNGTTGLAAFALTTYNNWLIVSGGYTYAGPVAVNYRVRVNSNGSLAGAWAATSGTSNLTAAKYYTSSVAYRGYLYVFGGCTAGVGQAGCSNYFSTVDRFVFNPAGGGVSGRTSMTGLPVAKALMAPAFYNGYIYLVGGATSASGQTNNVYYARINDDGSMGSWATATGTLVNELRRADALAMNGYLYVFGGHNGATNTTYGDIEISKIDLATGNLPNNFTNSVIKITPRWDERAVFSNGYMYATGGCATGPPAASCSSRSTLVEYVEIFNAGNKGTSAWSNSSNVYATNRTALAATAYNGYLYIAGGCVDFFVGTNWWDANCNTGGAIDSTAYAPINPDGSLGAWTTGPPMNTPDGGRAGGCLTAVGGTLYFLGGEDNWGTPMSTAVYSQIGANGVPGAWAAASSSIAGNGTPRAWHGCAVFNNRIYLTGGQNASDSHNTTVYYTNALPSGGDITGWSSGTAFSTARSHHASVVAGGYLFVLGGNNNTANSHMDVQSIQLDPATGATVGAWQHSDELPVRMSSIKAISANGYIYVFGGRDTPTTAVNTTYVTSVNSTGRVGEWSRSVNNFTTARFDAGVAFYNGYYYLLGGHDGTSIISTNVIQYGGQQSQSMKSMLSKYADLAGNGKPRAFVAYLTNAINNGVDIEKWRMKYRSSYESTNDWGAWTTVHPITSEQTYAMNSLDSAGTDIKLSRWFWFSLEMNMETSFTFTDDTRPTIYQYELHYSPPPAKRLMHGRDFRDQTQQGLDASPL